MTTTPTNGGPVTVSQEIRDLGLERYVLELEVDGLTVVPPDVHGFGADRVDRLVDLVLTEAEKLTGSPFSLEKGPHAELEFPAAVAGTSAVAAAAGKPSQFIIVQLARLDRVFRDLAVNRVAVALMRHLVGAKVTRFSSHNAMVKWQGEAGYGPTLGLHADQAAVPLPWGRAALTANTNWCLTDYTKEGGAFAYVPGSHARGMHPVQPQAAEAAIAVEAPKGSLIVFHGATWHGAYPRLIPGLRLMIANYYRHMMILPQEGIPNTFPRDLADDCEHPDLFRQLAGFSDPYPYAESRQPVPKVATTV